MLFPAFRSARLRLVSLSLLLAAAAGCNRQDAPPAEGTRADTGKTALASAGPLALSTPGPAPQTAPVTAPPPSAKPRKKAPQRAPLTDSAKTPTAGKQAAAGKEPGLADRASQPSPSPAKATDTLPARTQVPPGDTLPKPLRDLGQKALKVPEKLLFNIIWGGWSFRWVTAGQASLELHPTKNPAVWEIQYLAWANGAFQSIYPVRDTALSLIDSRGIYPLRFEKHLNEGSYHADISAEYDQHAHTLRTEDTTLSIEPFTHDVLSAFYFIRTQHLIVGDTLDLAAVSGKKMYSLKVLCHGRETIKVPAGEFRTLVVEPVLKGDGLFKAKGKLTIWVTDDEFHTPVKMVSKIPVGSIKVELVSKT